MQHIDALAFVEPVVPAIVAPDDVDRELLLVGSEDRLRANALAKLLPLGEVLAAVVREGLVVDLDHLRVACKRHRWLRRKMRARLGIPMLHSLSEMLKWLTVAPVDALQLGTDHGCSRTLAQLLLRGFLCRPLWDGWRGLWRICTACCRGCRTPTLLWRQPCRAAWLRRRRRLLEERCHQLCLRVGLGWLRLCVMRPLGGRRRRCLAHHRVSTHAHRPQARTS